MVKISAIVITYNEENNVVPLLNNLYPMFEEIVIVDGISTDKTIKRIEEYQDESQKIRLYLFAQNSGRYSNGWQQSSQRNLAIERATGEWILAIDADERLDGDARVRLEDAAQGDMKAWALPTYHYWETETQIRVDGYWYPNYHYRFWKHRQGIRYSKHSRHCFPIVKKYPEVRGVKELLDYPPYLNGVPIHHYHHCPIKKKGRAFRANITDVRTLQDLKKGLRVKEVQPRKRGPMEE